MKKRIFLSILLSSLLVFGFLFQPQPSNAEQNFYEVTIRKSLTAVKGVFTGDIYARRYLFRKQAAPVEETGAATLSAADLQNGLITITQSTGATVALTTATGTQIEKAFNDALAVNDSFDFTIINLSSAAADTATLTAGASGVSIVGAAVVQSAHSSSTRPNSAQFRVRKTAANTFVIYRIS